MKYALINKKSRIIQQIADDELQLPKATDATEIVEVDADQKVGDKAREDDEDDDAPQPA